MTIKKYWVKKSEMFTQKHLDELEELFAGTEYFGERVFSVILLSDLKKTIEKFEKKEALGYDVNENFTLWEVKDWEKLKKELGIE